MLIDRSPVTHVGVGDVGVLVVHGFTGNPFSVSGVVESMIAAGHDVEAPCLPGHGTAIDDMLTTSWAEWAGEVDRAADRLRERCRTVVAIGQSMGGSLVLRLAFDRSDLAAIACINPVTQGRDAATMEMLDELVDDGMTIIPGEGGSDIADPDGFDDAYDGTPLGPLVSMLREGVVPMEHRYDELSIPLLLISSRQDHVVSPADSEHLASTYGGPIEHRWLERSFHVATRDFERASVEAAAVEFVAAHTVVAT